MATLLIDMATRFMFCFLSSFQLQTQIVSEIDRKLLLFLPSLLFYVSSLINTL